MKREPEPGRGNQTLRSVLAGPRAWSVGVTLKVTIECDLERVLRGEILSVLTPRNLHRREQGLTQRMLCVCVCVCVCVCTKWKRPPVSNLLRFGCVLLCGMLRLTVYEAG